MLSLTDAAFAQIGGIRKQYLSAFPSDPPDTLAIAQGQFLSNGVPSGPKSISVGFFRKSEITSHLRTSRRLVRGTPYVILGTPETKRIFEAARLDYSPLRGFFVRG